MSWMFLFYYILCVREYVLWMQMVTLRLPKGLAESDSDNKTKSLHSQIFLYYIFLKTEFLLDCSALLWNQEQFVIL